MVLILVIFSFLYKSPYAVFMQKICRTFPHTAYVHKRKNRKLPLIGGALANGSAGGN
jgi:hypothetical protein